MTTGAVPDGILVKDAVRRIRRPGGAGICIQVRHTRNTAGIQTEMVKKLKKNGLKMILMTAAALLSGGLIACSGAGAAEAMEVMPAESRSEQIIWLDESDAGTPVEPDAENAAEAEAENTVESDAQEAAEADAEITAKAEDSDAADAPYLDPDGAYTSKDDVALYLYLYGELPDNFITKNEARDLGWPGGSLEPYAPGKSIGGDYFGNYEGKLPKRKGLQYHECDIDTMGRRGRGAKRIIYGTDGSIYYTDDHYESFTQLYEGDN